MSLEGKIFNVGGHPCGLMMREDFFMELFFFHGGYLRKVACSKMEVVGGRDSCVVGLS